VYWNGGGSGNIISSPIFDTQSPSTLSYTISVPTITAGVQYLFTVSAYNSVSESAQSKILSVIAASVPN
jgi:hypothetical protein